MAWFRDSLAPMQHLQMARMRSVETGRAVLVATITGVTAAIERGGGVVGSLPQFAEGRLDAEVNGHTGATPFARVGNRGAVALAALLVALAVFRKRTANCEHPAPPTKGRAM